MTTNLANESDKMRLFSLQASEPLTKSYTLKNGEIEKTPYPMTWEFTSHAHDVKTLSDIHTVMTAAAKKGHCLIKGILSRDLVKESRAGTTSTNDPTKWIVLDLDGLPDGMTVEGLLTELGLSDISYIVQYSASYGIMDKRVRAHVIMMLDKEYAAPLIKQWLTQKNHDVPSLRAAMELTKTGNSLRWPLDISACQNDKLIYIAPPVLKGIKDPMKGKARIQLVKKKHDVLSLAGYINNAEKNRQLTHARINELRVTNGIEKRKFNYRMVGSTEILTKPDQAIVTEMRIDRGFVYFNLNGGDSWAYYHPENKPDYIYNFKGEPTYLTKELLPDYWAEITSRAGTPNSKGVQHLAFCDRATGTYWRGSYDIHSDELYIYQAKTETQLRDFCKQHGVPIADFVPEWDLVFDPHDNVRVDPNTRTVNQFQPSDYMKAKPKAIKQCPPTIFKVMHHALGSDVDITEHFVNWVAYILQFRDRTKTAWVLHGTQGTGKGILTNNILRPLFGTNTTSRRMEELAEKYNHYMANSLLVFIDETQLSALNNEKGVMAKIKNFITEERVPIRAMYSNAVEMRNYCNFIFMSNMSDPLTIPKNDRRFNVSKYQPERLEITDQELKLIENELQAFHDYLLHYPVDLERVRQVINTEDRDNMIAVSESSIDTVVSALLEGRFGFFVDMLPTDSNYHKDAQYSAKVDDYINTLKALVARTTEDGKCSIARDELKTLFDYLTDNVPRSPNKFTSMLKHHRLHTVRIWLHGKAVYGITVDWKDTDQFPIYVANAFSGKKVTIK